MSVKNVIIGANGFIGTAFANRLCQLTKVHVDPDNQLPISNVTLICNRSVEYFQQHPVISKLPHFEIIKADLRDVESMKKVIEPADRNQQVVVYLFAAVLSGDAEKDFNLGMDVNLQAPMFLLNAMKVVGERVGKPLKLVYTSSVYVACMNEEQLSRPLTEERFRLSPASYGIQKACMELLICDYSRKGYVDGRVGRLSAIIGRPESFNSISAVFSMIFTQPLTGNDYKVPLPMDSVLPCSSVENTVECLLLLGGKIGGPALGHNRVVNLPAVSYSLNDIWDATQEAAARHGIQLGSISQVNPNEASTTFTQINTISAVDCTRSKLLGLPQDVGLKSLIDNFIIRENIKTK